MFLREEYAGGESVRDCDGSGNGSCGASLEGSGGAWVVALSMLRGGSGGGEDGACTAISVRLWEEERRCEEDRLLSSFMRLVERVRRNCEVKSRAQCSGNGSDSGCGRGTGFRRGTPLLSAIVVNAIRFDCGAGKRVGGQEVGGVGEVEGEAQGVVHSRRESNLIASKPPLRI